MHVFGVSLTQTNSNLLVLFMPDDLCSAPNALVS